MKIFDLLLQARKRLASAGIPEPKLDAELLLAHTLNQSRSWLLAHAIDALENETIDSYENLLKRRLSREPLAYILGHREFYGLDFYVSSAVLIPRQETELLVDCALDWSRNKSEARLIDVGTGSGCIAIACAVNHPTLSVFASDLSVEALAIAKKNAERYQDQLKLPVRLIQSNLLEAIQDNSLDVVVSNLPYIPERDQGLLEPEVKDWEPEMALYGGQTGFELFHRLIPEARRVLKEGGLLALEVGIYQAETVADLVKQNGFSNIGIINDLAGIPRIVSANV